MIWAMSLIAQALRMESLTSVQIKHALRAHHPAYHGESGMQWVCLEEWSRIDLLALECWREARVVGYEIKVSRGDMRSELLNPLKRYESVSRTTQFYFAVPAEMLTADEVEFEPPEWSLEDYERQPCTNSDCHAKHYLNGRGWMRNAPKPRGPKRRGTDSEGVTINFGHGVDVEVSPYGYTSRSSYQRTACCVVCGGYGRTGRSRVEAEAPTLWVPRDAGLVEVGSRGIVVVKEAPRNKTPKTIVGGPAEPDWHRNRLARQGLALLARHASAYQDPRHRGHR